MERKIGEIFEYNGEWYQCVKGLNCSSCFLNGSGNCDKFLCAAVERTDSTSVSFKKLEKVGEPFTGKVHIQLQRYNIYTKPIIDSAENVGYIDEGNTIAIEIKQNKENMEEYKMHDAREDIPEFDKVVDECLFGKQELKLKPFDLQKAKAGKPICTRDGRKARIICFDQEDIRPIVALIKLDNGGESAYYYYANGMNLSDNYQSVYDLMMLPEKKEGWVNVHMEETNSNERLAEQVIYKTRKDAFDNACPRGYKATVKIEWEE